MIMFDVRVMIIMMMMFLMLFQSKIQNKKIEIVNHIINHDVLLSNFTIEHIDYVIINVTSHHCDEHFIS